MRDSITCSYSYEGRHTNTYSIRALPGQKVQRVMEGSSVSIFFTRYDPARRIPFLSGRFTIFTIIFPPVSLT